MLFIFIFPFIPPIPVWQKPDSRTDGRTDCYASICPIAVSFYSTCAFDLFFYIGLKTTATDDAYPILVILARSFTAHVSQTRFFNTSLMISSVVFYLVLFIPPACGLRFVDFRSRSRSRSRASLTPANQYPISPPHFFPFPPHYLSRFTFTVHFLQTSWTKN